MTIRTYYTTDKSSIVKRTDMRLLLDNSVMITNTIVTNSLRFYKDGSTVTHIKDFMATKTPYPLERDILNTIRRFHRPTKDHIRKSTTNIVTMVESSSMSVKYIRTTYMDNLVRVEYTTDDGTITEFKTPKELLDLFNNDISAGLRHGIIP